MRFRCPSCQTVFQVDAIPTGGMVRCPGCQTTVRIGAASPGAGAASVPAPNLPAPPPEPDIGNLPPLRYQPQTLPAYLTQPPPPPPPREPKYRAGRDWDEAPRRSKRPRSATSIVLWIVGGWLALMLLLVVVGVVGYAVYNSNLMKAEMTLAGYSTQAPGRFVGENRGSGQIEVMIQNRRTRSQYQMIHVHHSFGRQVTPELFLLGMEQMGTVSERSPITRGGLQGFHFRATNSRTSAPLEGEVFPVSDGLLVLTYQRGSELLEANGRDAKYEGQRERDLDDPDSFFASLKKK